jgi:hypothetical protein
MTLAGSSPAFFMSLVLQKITIYFQWLLINPGGSIQHENDMGKLRADKYWLALFASFGSMGHWPPGAPRGSLDQRAEGLLALVQRYSDQPADKWPIKKIVVRGMALELTEAFTQAGEPATPALLHLLATLLELPASFLADPIPLFKGKDGRGQAADPRCRNQAMWIEGYHLRKHGKPVSKNRLAKQVGVSRDTVAQWRKERDYKDFVNFTGAVRIDLT